MHGGAVEVHSDGGPGRGSTFTVRLATVEPDEHARPTGNAASDAVARSAPRRILIVDDNRDSACSLAALLQHQGHETFTAFDGAGALQAVASVLPDVVLLDLGLPGYNGYEVARKLRDTPLDQQPLLVALTGWGQEDDRRRSREAGFDAHFVKPLDLARFADLLTQTQVEAPAAATAQRD